MRNSTLLSWLRPSTFAGLFVVALGAMPAFAEAPRAPAVQNPDLHQRLKEFRSQAFQLRSSAATLKSFTPNSRMSWQTHVYSLDTIREQINDLGRKLAVLETMNPEGNESHQMAIENARPHLVATAEELREAIAMVNDNRRSVERQPYTETVDDLYNHAASLYQTVDTILDYENARVRLERLELPTSAGGR